MSVARTSAPLVRAVLAELGGALVGGALLTPVAALLVGLLFAGAGLGMGLLSLQVFAGVVGFGAGAGAGAAIAGWALGQRGTWWLGVLIGAVTALAVILLIRLLTINVGGLFGIFWIGAPLTLIAAVVGYNLRRQP